LQSLQGVAFGPQQLPHEVKLERKENLHHAHSALHRITAPGTPALILFHFETQKDIPLNY
jgi:hypothetical protein